MRHLTGNMRPLSVCQFHARLPAKSIEAGAPVGSRAKFRNPPRRDKGSFGETKQCSPKQQAAVSQNSPQLKQSGPNFGLRALVSPTDR